MARSVWTAQSAVLFSSSVFCGDYVLYSDDRTDLVADGSALTDANIADGATVTEPDDGAND